MKIVSVYIEYHVYSYYITITLNVDIIFRNRNITPHIQFFFFIIYETYTISH